MAGTLAGQDVLFEHAACGLVLADAKGTILRANATFCNWLGYQSAELAGQYRIQDFFTMGGRVFHQTHCTPMLELRGSVAEVQVDMLHRDRTRLPMLMNIVRHQEGEVSVDAFALFIATERRSYERELLAARKAAETALDARRDAEARLSETNEKLSLANRRKDEFLAMLAHELRNPLAPISAAAQLLQRGQIDEQRVLQASHIIKRQADHMTNLVDDLLDVSRVTQGLAKLDQSPIDIRHVVSDAVEQAATLIQAKRHHLTLHLSRDAAVVYGDKKRLVQIISNILNNASKYTHEGGNISIRTALQGPDVEIEIVDDGMGMSPDLTRQAFDLFTQAERTSDRSSGGLGIGLALVKSLVELHGGTITCHSDGIGHGSQFRILLPKSTVTNHSETADSAHRALAGAAIRLRITVVDDNVDAAVMLAMLLETAGHDVQVEHDSRVALENASANPPDLFLLDIGLPGMDGNELAQRLRAQPATAKSILMAVTGYGQENDRDRTRNAGFDYHLVKPIDVDQLLSILATVRTD